jgi:hypothetical protein
MIMSGVVFLLLNTITPAGFIRHIDEPTLDRKRVDILHYLNKEYHVFANSLFPVLVSAWLLFDQEFASTAEHAHLKFVIITYSVKVLVTFSYFIKYIPSLIIIIILGYVGIIDSCLSTEFPSIEVKLWVIATMVLVFTDILQYLSESMLMKLCACCFHNDDNFHNVDNEVPQNGNANPVIANLIQPAIHNDNEILIIPIVNPNNPNANPNDANVNNAIPNN